MTHLRHLPRPLTSARLALLGGAIALTVLGACADGPTAPAAPLQPTAQPSAGLLGDLLGTTTTTLATVLTRSTPLSAPVSVAAVIGSEGGRLTVPGTGLTLTVPAGAVRTPTRFTITAPAGRGIWYEFGPSGARFDVPLVVTQELPLTLLSGLLGSTKIDAVYFADGTQNESTGTAVAKEVLPITLNATGTRATFKVTHFSGYMVSTGRQRSFSDDE
jgi:hypothetical protein